MREAKKSGHSHQRGRFSGKIGYVLAVAGSAVGLGNIGVFRTWQRNMEEECSCWFIFF